MVAAEHEYRAAQELFRSPVGFLKLNCPHRPIIDVTSDMDEEVFAFLLEQVQCAKDAYDQAKRNFWDVTRKLEKLPKVPAGQRYSDGALLLQRVVAHEKFTTNTYLETMRRLNCFLMLGTIPDDVREKLGKTNAAGT